ncbi:hypothetical protein L6654_42710, partial [Bradyrhizobium sp. WYCCWR 13023]|nr:hypothetical protein [Bradyrhizobium zhengyangense]
SLSPQLSEEGAIPHVAEGAVFHGARHAAETIDVPGFRAKIEKYRPGTIAFTSKKAASLFYGRPSAAIALGRQKRDESLPEIFVLPSPSGAASGHWTLEPWRELARWIAA